LIYYYVAEHITSQNTSSD